MTRYEQGFMNKCAEYGVDPVALWYGMMAKSAQRSAADIVRARTVADTKDKAALAMRTPGTTTATKLPNGQTALRTRAIISGSPATARPVASAATNASRPAAARPATAAPKPVAPRPAPNAAAAKPSAAKPAAPAWSPSTQQMDYAKKWKASGGEGQRRALQLINMTDKQYSALDRRGKYEAIERMAKARMAQIRAEQKRTNTVRNRMNDRSVEANNLRINGDKWKWQQTAMNNRDTMDALQAYRNGDMRPGQSMRSFKDQRNMERSRLSRPMGSGQDPMSMDMVTVTRPDGSMVQVPRVFEGRIQAAQNKVTPEQGVQMARELGRGMLWRQQEDRLAGRG